MSMPNIPNISPEIDVNICDVVNLLLASIALEELGLAHIINAEGEKIQEVIGNNPCLGDLVEIDKSVDRTLQNVIKKEMLLQFKLENVLDLIDKTDCFGECNNGGNHKNKK
ncbi:MAG: hypothetical protein K0R80_98 [Clostridia bacterium]|jgi:hypothetical protein|nr:hypothetical protein [Clostridia bacterium]